MNHAVGRWLKVGVLTFVTAALVACAGAAGKPGAPGEPGQPGAPGEPGVVAPLPPLVVGIIGDMTLQASETSEVALSTYFNDPEGGVLTYTATSSAAAVAAVGVSGSTLTVTAVADGSTTITVTAKDTDSLTVRQTFLVTVGDSGPVDPAPVILDVGEIQTVTFEAGQTVVSGDIQIFTVVRKAGTAADWEVTGVTKGVRALEILENDEIVEERRVTVNNQAPYRNDVALPTKPYKLVAITSNEIEKEKYFTQAEHEELDELNLYRLVAADEDDPFKGLYDYFQDPDGDGLSFSGFADRTNHVVVAAIKKDGTEIIVDMLRNDPTINTFRIVVQAKDGGKPGDPLDSRQERLEVETNEPLAQTYTVIQHEQNHNFMRIAGVASVGLRTDAEHKLDFIGGFGFATDVTHKTPLEKPDKASKDGYLIITSTGGVKVVEGLEQGTKNAASKEGILLSFSVTATGAASIKVTFHKTTQEKDANGVFLTPVSYVYSDPVSRTLHFSVALVDQDPVFLD